MSTSGGVPAAIAARSAAAICSGVRTACTRSFYERRHLSGPPVGAPSFLRNKPKMASSGQDWRSAPSDLSPLRILGCAIAEPPRLGRGRRDAAGPGPEGRGGVDGEGKAVDDGLVGDPPPLEVDPHPLDGPLDRGPAGPQPGEALAELHLR